jgi:hypothetical protein
VCAVFALEIQNAWPFTLWPSWTIDKYPLLDSTGGAEPFVGILFFGRHNSVKRS